MNRINSLQDTRTPITLPLKVCKKHGDLFIGDVQEEKASWKDGTYLRCSKCRREKDLKYKSAHHEQHISYSKKWREENKEQYNEWTRQDRKKDPEKHKAWAKKTREKAGSMRNTKEIIRIRGLSLDQYEEMVKKQNGLCAICLKPEKRKSRTEGNITRLSIDHCHKTNRIRRLLCHDCNTGIGKFDDSIETLQSAINYLKEFVTSG